MTLTSIWSWSDESPGTSYSKSKWPNWPLNPKWSISCCRFHNALRDFFVHLVMIHNCPHFREDRQKQKMRGFSVGGAVEPFCHSHFKLLQNTITFLGFVLPANFGEDLSMSRPRKSPKREIIIRKILTISIGPPTVRCSGPYNIHCFNIYR